MAGHVFELEKGWKFFPVGVKKHEFGVRNSGKKVFFFSAAFSAFLICTKV